MKVLLTGGAGFAGSYIAEEIAKETDWDIIVLDCLTYAGHLENLDNVPKDRLRFIYWDFRNPLPDSLLEIIGQIDYIIHNGAETHVKTSFENPELFVQSNVVGTLNMLEAARKLKPKIFLYVSTDEVFGTATIGQKEDDALNPSNPYSASKAAGEFLVKVYHKCYGMPYLITRTMNMYGKRQDAEKFIPMVFRKMEKDKVIDFHCDEFGNPGSRQWIHASDQASALLFLLEKNVVNETFHIAGERKDNSEVIHAIGNVTDKLSFLARKVCVFEQYPGHDLHYALDDSKIRAMGWAPKLTFEQGLALTV